MVNTPFLAKRYSRKGLYYAWLIIVVGLIIPFRPQWGNAVINVEMPTSIPLPVVHMSSEAPGYASLPATLPVFTTPYLNNNVISSTAPNISWWQIGFMVWLAGLIIFIAYHSVKYYFFTKTARRWSKNITDERVLFLLQNLKSEMGITRKIPVYLCACVGSPMMIGLFKPRILIPSGEFAQDELRFILKHELVHYRRKDLLYKYLVMAATALHWFNPVVYMMARAINVQCETSCDAEVLRSADINTRQSYGEIMIGVAQYRSKLKTVLATNFYGGKNSMRSRILSIMDTRKKSRGIFIICVMLVLVMVIGTVFAVQAQSYTIMAQPSEYEATCFNSAHNFNSFEDLVEPLRELGLVFMNTSSYPHVRDTLDFLSPHLGRLCPNIPIVFYSEADVDVLLALARIVIEQRRGGFGWDTYVDYALDESGLYDYWRHGIRELARPGRQKQLIQLAENYTLAEITEKYFSQRPCLLLEFQELGFFLDVVLDGDVSNNDIPYQLTQEPFCQFMQNRLADFGGLYLSEKTESMAYWHDYFVESNSLMLEEQGFIPIIRSYTTLEGRRYVYEYFFIDGQFYRYGRNEIPLHEDAIWRMESIYISFRGENGPFLRWSREDGNGSFPRLAD